VNAPQPDILEVDGEVAAIVNTAFAAATPKPLDGEGRFFSLVIPDGQERFIVDLEAEREHLLDRPRRKVGVYSVADASSLLAYLAKHGTPDTELWADPQAYTVTAVVNAHATELAGHGDHRAVLAMRKTKPWAAWAAHDRKMLPQLAFAEHIEDRLPDIVNPPAAEMLEMAQTFNAKRSIAFESSKALSTGLVQLEYRETVDAKAGQKGRLDIPQRFTLRLVPFEGGRAQEISARLRYRINDGNLTLGYYLDRPEDVLDEAFNDVLSALQTGQAAPLYVGRTAG
jgi:uncharacterized protein YfdQ (DUF2303 family)